MFLSAGSGGPTTGPVTWTGLVNAATIGPANNGLQKTGGCNGCADAGAYSVQTLASGDGYVEFTAIGATAVEAGPGDSHPAAAFTTFRQDAFLVELR